MLLPLLLNSVPESADDISDTSFRVDEVVLTEILVRQMNWAPAVPGKPARVDFFIGTPLRDYHTYIAGAGLQVQHGLEAGVALALLPAMRTGMDLRVDGYLSDTFLHGVKKYIDVFTQALPEFKTIDVKPLGTYLAKKVSGSSRCASFFSGGVDSFYTLLKGAEEITDIIYIHGFDVRLDDLARRRAVDEMGHAVSTELGVTYLAIESNLGKVLQDFGKWAEHAHGLAMLAVSRVLAGYVSEVRIPGTFSVAEQKPWGSWLQTDPLFSDERLHIVHDACDARRMDKVRRLASEPLALQYMRVCWGSVEGMNNCCRCEKCLRTMTSLHILGVLEGSSAFTLPLDTALVAQVCLPVTGLRIFPRENLALLRESKRDMPELERALTRQLNRPIWLARLRLKWRKRFLRWQRKLQLP